MLLQTHDQAQHASSDTCQETACFFRLMPRHSIALLPQAQAQHATRGTEGDPTEGGAVGVEVWTCPRPTPTQRHLPPIIAKDKLVIATTVSIIAIATIVAITATAIIVLMIPIAAIVYIIAIVAKESIIVIATNIIVFTFAFTTIIATTL